MRTTVALSLVLLCAGCRPSAPTRVYNAERDGRLACYLESEDLWQTVTNAATALPGTNAAYFLDLLSYTLDRKAVDTLTRLDGLGELARKLDTAQRGTARHPYTPAQIEEARSAKLEAQRGK